MSAIGSSMGISSSLNQTQLQKIMQQYGCSQVQALQILNGKSPDQVLQNGSSTASTTSINSSSTSANGSSSGHHGAHPPVTLTKTDPTSGKVSTVTANSKSEVQSYEAQGYVKQDKNSSGAISKQLSAMASMGMAQILMQK